MKEGSKEFDLIPGQILQCEVIGEESEGVYKIASQSLGDLTGLLRCTGELAAGTKLEACFVCMHQGVAVFMAREPIQNLKEGAMSRAEEVPKFVEEEGFNANVLTLVLQTKGAHVDEAKRKEHIASILGELEEQKITLETYLERKSILSKGECNSITRGKALLDRGVITWAQFSVAFWDELATGMKMEESLTARGWL